MNRLERIIYQLTIVVIFIFTASLQAGETLHLIETKGEYALRDSLALLEDKTGKLTIDEIRGEQYQSQFAPLGPGKLNRGFSQSAFWLRLKLTNHSKSISRWVLQQDFSNTHYMDVYIPSATSSGYTIKKSGNFRPQKNKEIFYRKPAFYLSLPYQQEKTVYIRIKSEAAISLALRILSPNVFIEKVSVEKFLLGIFYGILAIMVFYNIFLSLRLYDKNFLYLALFIGFGILMLLFYDSIIQLLISEKLIDLNRIGLPIFLVLTMYFLLKFTDSFMPLRGGAFLIRKMGTGLQILWLLAMIMVPFVSYMASVQSLVPLALLTLLFSAYRALVCKHAQNHVNKYVYIAWVLLMLGIGGVILTRLGLINSGFIVEHGIRFGLVCFVLFMSLALADQIRQTKLNEIKAIKALSDSEAKYRVLFEYAYDAIVIMRTSSNTIIDCNNSSLNVFGRTREEIIGCTPIDLSPERQYDGVLSKIRAEVLLKDVVAGKHRQFEWLHMRPDGSLFDAEVALSPVQIGGENMIQAIVRDITNEKRVQNAIKHIAAGVFGKTGRWFFDRMVMQLAELFNASYAFIGLLDKDDKGVIKTYSICADGKILENVAYTVKGTPCENIIDQSGCTYPDSVQQQFPQDILLKQMGVVSYIGMPLFDSQSVPLGLISVMSRERLDNISYFKDTLQIFAARAGAEFERLETEKKLVDVKQKLSLHVQQTPLGVIEWDTDFRVVEWNHSAEGIFGYSRNDALGCTASELLIPEEALVHVDKIWDGLLKNKGGERSTNKNTTKSNETITCEWYNTPLVTTEGKVIGVASMVSDISDRVKADEELGKYQTHLEELVEARTVELKQANKELESFSYSISHDLRAPLRAIDGFSHILLDEYSNILDRSGKEYLQRVCNGSQKMALLIDDLLKLSQVNRANIEMKAVSLSSLISESFAKLQEYDTNREATLTIMPDVIVQGDQHLLAIAIDNLAGNAWKYTSKSTNTVIGFGVEELNGEKVYCINDNGVGFDMKYADRLFGAFQRLHGGSEFEGSGIGLATVSRIISRHGGRIWADAEIDHGAKFSFTLNRKI